MFLSDVFALAAAICIAASGMLIHELNGRVGILRLARWQMTTAFIMTGMISFMIGGWRAIVPWQVGLLAASSASGIIIASTAYYAAIYTSGPRVTALLFSITSPIVLVLGYLILGETITQRQSVGVALVLAGVVLAIGLPMSRTKTPLPTPVAPNLKALQVPWLGIAFGLTLAVGQAFGSLFARPAMAAGVEPFTAMAIRSGIAAVFFITIAAVPFKLARTTEDFSYRFFGIGIAAALIGTGLGMSLLMAALAHGNAGIVSTLSSMTPVVILPMVWLRTGKMPRRDEWIGAVLAVCGTACISL